MGIGAIIACIAGGVSLVASVVGWLFWASRLVFRLEALEKDKEQSDRDNRQLELDIQSIKVSLARIETELLNLRRSNDKEK